MQLQLDLGEPMRHRTLERLPGWGYCGRQGRTEKDWQRVTCPHCHSLDGCLSELRKRGEVGPARAG